MLRFHAIWVLYGVLFLELPPDIPVNGVFVHSELKNYFI